MNIPRVNYTIKNNIKRTLRYFPGRDNINNLKDLKNKWEFLVISSHGSLIPDKFIKIPKDTYVIFNCTSGIRSISKYGIPYKNLLITKYSDDSDSDNSNNFYKKMLEEIKNPISLLKTFISTSDKSYYPNNYEEKERVLMKSIKNYSLNDDQKSRAIYPPNSEVIDMMLYFNNQFVLKPYKGFILGVHKLPIKFKVYDKYNPRRTHNFTKNNIQRYNISVSKNIAHDTIILPDLISKSISLSELFTLLPEIPNGKKRFIFITGCREIEFNETNSELQPLFKRLSRKFSVGQHENVEPGSKYNIIGKESKKNLIIYSHWKRLGILDNKTMKINVKKLPICIYVTEEYKHLFPK
jgi:hypothetical protein